MSSSSQTSEKNNDNTDFTDEQVSNFMAFTGSSDPSRATSYLEMAGGDLQNAVALYLDHQQTGSSSNNSNNNSNSRARGGNRSRNRTTSTNNSNNLSASSTAGGDGEVRAPDATRTMRLMDFDNGMTNVMPTGAGGGISDAMVNSLMSFSGGSSGIRDGLMDNAFAVDGDNSDSFREVINRAVEAEMEVGDHNEMRRAETGNAEGIDGDDENKDEDEDDEVVEVNSAIDSFLNAGSNTRDSTEHNRIRRLGDMFEAPTHLIYNRGGFQGARNVAKDARRWLLVNLQCDSDFACHTLNRDVWRDELVENLVREGFIFWQSSNIAPDGQTYAQRYNVTGYPHIAIIDPRTGRQMWKKEGWTAENPFTAQMFAERAADFCSHHSFDKEPVAPRAASSDTASLQHNASSGGGHSSSLTEQMTEEQQLQAAIRASMNADCEYEQASENNDDDRKMEAYVVDDDDVSEGDDDDVVCLDSPPQNSDDVTGAVPMQDVEGENTSTVFEQEITAMDIGEEPTGKDGVARVMIRMPDGKRLVRKFLLTDAVKIIYAFVVQSNDEARNGKSFECKVGFPPKDLLTHVNDTIESIGLGGDTVTVMWKG